jgi:Zn-dependent protease
MIEFTKLQQFILYLIPTLFAITIHEVAHGWVAKKCGDRTAQMLGRLTLNPIKHIDVVGTILVPAASFFLGGFIFGWAKPVPVTWENLKNKRRDMALVALAGPVANIIMAIFWVILWKLSPFIYGVSQPLGIIMAYMGQIGVFINLVLMVLNLLPIPPLDGSRIVSSFLSPRNQWEYGRIEPYGLFILLGLMATGILGKILGPIVMFFHSILAVIFQLPL